MIKGIGCDLVEIARIAKLWAEKPEGLARKVFLEREIAFCESHADSVDKLAARFAAKEATLKALGTGWAEGLALNQVEVVREKDSPPQVVLHGAAKERADALGVEGVWLTLSHDNGMAMAMVVLEG